MTKTKRPVLSGFCSPSNPPDSHERCEKYVADCPCFCHWKPEPTAKASRFGDAEIVDVEYLSDEWYAARREGVAASEIAAVLGISPWVSPFDLWWAKHTGVDSQPENNRMRRGRRYEALILEDFADEHPELHIGKSLTLRNRERPWQVSTPDGLAFEAGAPCTCDTEPTCDKDAPIAVVEAKTGQRWEWGEPGTDDIPVHYRCQVLWQMDTVGTRTAYLPVLFGDQYEEYVVEYDEADVALMRAAAQTFLESLREGRQPEIDDHKATLRRLKKMHDSVTDGEVEVPAAVVAQYHAAKRLRDAAEARMRLAESRVRSALGDRNVATVDGRKVAGRSVYDVRERTQTIRAHTVNRLTFSKPKTQGEEPSNG